MTVFSPVAWPNEELRVACCEASADRNLAFVYVSLGLGFRQWISSGGMASELTHNVVLVLAPGPLDPACLLEWREGLSQLDPPVVFRFVRSPENIPAGGWQSWIESTIGDFGRAVPEEPTALVVGSLVRVPEPRGTSGGDRGYEPYVLAIPPDGPLAPVLTRLDAVRRTFEAMRPADLEDERRKLHNALDEMLRDPSPATQEALHRVVERSKLSRCDRTQLPRVLLLGESGTGKTVLARYLATHELQEIPFDRVPIPEYLGREDHFEPDVFGYCKGAYTGARDEGSRGALGQLLGGVVFFDEIGDANATIQAKLLAYLDDYIVRPRGLSGRGFYCPTLVVAATNRDVRSARGGDGATLRPDLLNRFNELIAVPSLSDRRSEIDLQVDLLLQQQSFGSDFAAAHPIRRVGETALERIRSLDFNDKNFRLLERVLSTACGRARSERRAYLVGTDIQEAV